MSRFPPKPVLALTIGVAGHRLRRPGVVGEAFDAGAVSQAICDTLQMLQTILRDLHAEYGAWFDPKPPLLALVGSLAEGADRIAAEAAAAFDIKYDAVLPFAQPAYETTFENDASRDDFRKMLGKARAVLTLPGVGDTQSPAGQSKSFEICANTVLAQADLLLAVWDGKPAQGLGGTGDTVDEAARQGVPILIVDPKGRISLRWAGDFEFPLNAHHAADMIAEEDLEAGLRKVLDALVRPPGAKGDSVLSGHKVAGVLRQTSQSMAPPTTSGFAKAVLAPFRAPAAGLEWVARCIARGPVGDTEREGLRSYLETPVNRGYWLPGWWLLKKVLRVETRRAAEVEPPDLAGGAPSNVATLGRLQTALDAADDIGLHYSHGFRHTFVFNFLFGAAAAFCVAWSVLLLAQGDHAQSDMTGYELGLKVLELLLVALIVVQAFIANSRQWRRRWSESREVAERLRVADRFWILGVWPHVLSAMQPAWTGWYVRSILREQPVFACDLSARLADVRARLQALVKSQQGYHGRTIREFEHMDRKLDLLGKAALIASIAVLVIVVGAHVLKFEQFAPRHDIATMLAIALPAFATAMYGIRLLGDFEDTVLRSKRMYEKLERLDRLLNAEPPNLLELRTRASQMASIMLDDVESWRIVVESRNLSEG